MTEPEMCNWIRDADYTHLLRKCRFAGVGDPFFQGEVGDFFQKTMLERKEEIGSAAAVSVSKQIGWG